MTLARTTFFGRTREKERLADLIDSVPLVTLTGVGGAGKTRLAAELAGDFAGEVRWCELAALRSGDAVARELGSPFLEAWAVYIIGTIVIDEPGRAEACFRESLAIASTTKYSLTVGNSKRQLARLAARAGRDEEAAGLFADAIAHFARTEDHSQTWDALRSTSLLLAAEFSRYSAGLQLSR